MDNGKGIVVKAAFVAERLSKYARSRLLAIVCFRLFKDINTCHAYHLDVLEWVANTTNMLVEANDKQKTLIDDMRLVLAAKEHDLEATKRELAALKDKYGI